MAMREYSVTYTTKDGQRLMETVAARSHHAVERRIADLGGTIIALDRADDEYPRKVRTLRRTIGCSTLVILLVVLAVVLYWSIGRAIGGK